MADYPEVIHLPFQIYSLLCPLIADKIILLLPLVYRNQKASSRNRIQSTLCVSDRRQPELMCPLHLLRMLCEQWSPQIELSPR